MLLVGWGSTHGSITSAREVLADDGIAADHVHITHLHPFPPNLGELLEGYDHVFVPELNKGQLVKVLRAEFLVDAKPISKVMGLPFTATELANEVKALINENGASA